ncbi:MAG: HU family DNA-binding protein [Cyanobacteria bacterium P01_H01_bin.121]
MNKAQLVDEISERTGLSKKDITKVIDALVSAIMQAVSNGDKVGLVGFGTFERRERSARTGRNPKTGEPIEISASSVPVFKAGKQFKETVNF